jgi:hypothetical protein
MTNDQTDVPDNNIVAIFLENLMHKSDAFVNGQMVVLSGVESWALLEVPCLKIKM